MITIPYTLAIVLTCSLLMSNTAVQPSTETLLDQISHGPYASAAEKQLEIRGAKNAYVQKVLSEKLPLMLSQTKDPKPLILLAKLAGTLKIDSTIPVLCELVVHGGYMAMSTTIYQSQELIDDPIGAALASIGNASVPAVSAMLGSPNSRTRSRAVRMLAKIDSPEALSALRDASKSENDPIVRSLIQGTTQEKTAPLQQKP